MNLEKLSTTQNQKNQTSRSHSQTHRSVNKPTPTKSPNPLPPSVIKKERKMTVSQFSATFFTRWSEEVLTCDRNLKPIATPTARNPYQTWCHATKACRRTSISGATAMKPTASVQTAIVSFFFLILPISAMKPIDNFSHQTHYHRSPLLILLGRSSSLFFFSAVVWNIFQPTQSESKSS